MLGHRTRSGFAAAVVATGALTLACAPAPQPPGDDPAPTTPTTVAPDPGERGYPGDVPDGTLRWGAAVGGNADPGARHEQPAGEPLALRRTFWRWDQRATSMIATAEDDLANDRLPWVSVKPGGPWAGMGSGAHDAEIDEMLQALEATGGPVWLTVHHEPEGGGGVNAPDDPGGPEAWRAMQRRVRERMDALGTTNIAFAPILMSWTWDSRPGRTPEDWWEPGIWDFFGIDHYVETETSPAGETWDSVREWVGDRGIDVAVGEWGMRGTDAAAGRRVRDWYDHAAGSAGDSGGAQVVGVAAFDSGLNAPTGSWELAGGQLTAFHDLLGDPRTLTAHE